LELFDAVLICTGHFSKINSKNNIVFARNSRKNNRLVELFCVEFVLGV